VSWCRRDEAPLPLHSTQVGVERDDMIGPRADKAQGPESSVTDDEIE
jgi:hypothetical protein